MSYEVKVSNLSTFNSQRGMSRDQGRCEGRLKALDCLNLKKLGVQVEVVQDADSTF